MVNEYSEQTLEELKLPLAQIVTEHDNNISKLTIQQKSIWHR